MKKLLFLLVIASVFVTTVLFAKDFIISPQSMGPIVGLLAVSIGYFVSKTIAQVKTK